MVLILYLMCCRKLPHSALVLASWFAGPSPETVSAPDVLSILSDYFIGYRRTNWDPPDLDGVGERRLGGLGHEGDEERGQESDHPEHHEGDLGPVHLKLHDEGSDL